MPPHFSKDRPIQFKCALLDTVVLIGTDGPPKKRTIIRVYMIF